MSQKQEVLYANYYQKNPKEIQGQIVPNVKGMAGMDAVALLENLGLKVKFSWHRKSEKKQSINPGDKNLRKIKL